MLSDLPQDTEFADWLEGRIRAYAFDQPKVVTAKENTKVDNLRQVSDEKSADESSARGWYFTCDISISGPSSVV